MFHEQGLQAEILWRCTKEEKGLRPTAIRNLIKNGQTWEHLVQEKVVLILQKILSTRQIWTGPEPVALSVFKAVYSIDPTLFVMSSNIPDMQFSLETPHDTFTSSKLYQ